MFDGLDFDEQGLFDDEVSSVTAVELQALVDQGNRALSCKGQSPKHELMAHALLVGRFEQAWPQMAVYLDAGSDDGPGEFVRPRLLGCSLLHSPVSAHQPRSC